MEETHKIITPKFLNKSTKKHHFPPYSVAHVEIYDVKLTIFKGGLVTNPLTAMLINWHSTKQVGLVMKFRGQL